VLALQKPVGKCCWGK